jgi:c-di-GMP-binding flagellar brake protein YcgR
VKVRFNYGGQSLEIPANIVCNDLTHAEKYHVGIKFDSLSAEQEQKLIRMIYSVQEDWKVNEDVDEGFIESFIQLLVAPVNTFVKLKKITRTQPRLKVSLPCVIETDGRMINAYTKGISSGGVSLVAPKEKLFDDATLRLRISYENHPLVSGDAQLVWRKSRIHKDLLGIRWAEDHPSLYEALNSMRIKKVDSETTEGKPS